MELHERIAAVRRAAGLTQEQLGEQLGVTRQAVSKWESGQTVPDAHTVARLCQVLHVSADYVLLGIDPETQQSVPNASADRISDATPCPCCGRPVPGSLCPVCGYSLPASPPKGPRYAIIDCTNYSFDKDQHQQALETYCGIDSEHASALVAQSQEYGTLLLLRRGLSDSAAQYIATHLLPASFQLRIVLDEGEPSDEALLTKPKAMELPAPTNSTSNGLGFWGVVGAVIAALLILSIF